MTSSALAWLHQSAGSRAIDARFIPKTLELQRQRELHTDLTAELAFDEIFDAVRDIQALGTNAALQLSSNVLTGISRPAFSRVERDDPQHLVVLTTEQVVD